MTALERLKMIQAQFKARWVGINCDYTGRPGTSLMCNQDRKFPIHNNEIEENLRSERFQRILETLRNIENEQALLIPSHENRAGRSGQNFFNNKRHEPKDKSQLL